MSAPATARLIVLFLVSQLAFAAPDPVDQDQLRKAALKIISEYGSRGTLSRSQMRNYLNDEAFRAIDTDKDNVLQFVEYRNAKLYCTRPDTGRIEWRCDTDQRAIELRFDALANGQNLFAKDLLTKDRITWAPIVEQQLEAWWSRANPASADTLVADELVRLFTTNALLKRATPGTTLQTRLANYPAQDGSITVDDIDSEVALIGLATADTNISASVDLLEFLKALDGPTAVSDYNELLMSVEPPTPILAINKIGKSQMEAGVGGSTLDHISWKYSGLIAEASDGAIGNSQNINTAVANINAIVIQEQEARQRKTVRSGPFGSAYVKDRGIIFPPNAAIYDAASKTVSIKEGESFTTLRVIQDFTKAGSKAAAGSLTWSKDAGSSPSPDINVSVRVDRYIESWDNLRDGGWRIRPAGGVHYNRVGRGDDKTDVRKAFIVFDTYLADGDGFLRASHFQFGPVLEKDQVAQTDKLTGLIEWEPVLAFPGFTTGVYYPLSKNVQWYARPRLALELNNILDKPAASNVVDSSFYRYGLEFGWQFGERATLTYDYRQRHSTNDTDEDYHFQTAQLEWQLDEFGVYKLTFGFSQGRDTPDFKRVEQYKMGLGVKF